MDLVVAIFILVLICVAFWANNAYMSPPPAKFGINVLLIAIVIIWILQLMGVVDLLHHHIN